MRDLNPFLCSFSFISHGAWFSPTSVNYATLFRAVIFQKRIAMKSRASSTTAKMLKRCCSKNHERSDWARTIYFASCVRSWKGMWQLITLQLVPSSFCVAVCHVSGRHRKWRWIKCREILPQQHAEYEVASIRLWIGSRNSSVLGTVALTVSSE